MVWVEFTKIKPAWFFSFLHLLLSCSSAQMMVLGQTKVALLIEIRRPHHGEAVMMVGLGALQGLPTWELSDFWVSIAG